MLGRGRPYGRLILTTPWTQEIPGGNDINSAVDAGVLIRGSPCLNDALSAEYKLLIGQRLVVFSVYCCELGKK